MPSPINISGFVITFWLDLASGVVCFPQAIEIYAERFGGLSLVADISNPDNNVGRGDS
jgi:hypothetical protein